jgi:hypothetical protein
MLFAVMFVFLKGIKMGIAFLLLMVDACNIIE